MSAKNHNHRQTVEFGDFQTPSELTDEICHFLLSMGVRPDSVIEPTCGTGAFIVSAMDAFEQARKFLGIEINGEYLLALEQKLGGTDHTRIELKNEDFFQLDWEDILTRLPQPILLLGNPPWVTNSGLGRIRGSNLPAKSNFQGHKGFDAITGKANFDISEWMLIHLLDKLQSRSAVLAMLCKTTVARKVLKYIWNRDFCISDTRLYIIDSKAHFNVSVSACLLVCKTGAPSKTKSCDVFQGISEKCKISEIGMHNTEILADLKKYEKWSQLDGHVPLKWRSGVKHDCARIMEFTRKDDTFVNGMGEVVDIEDTFMFPLYKSSHVVKCKTETPERWVLIPQRKVGDETRVIREKAPRTWAYLTNHADKLDQRKSSIYKNKPRFSIFGIGDYSFAQWKVATSGLYKKIQFSIIPPLDGKPAMVDDTCYFLPCTNRDEAILFADLLNSKAAREFLHAFIFWDAKRPITADILKRLDLIALAKILHKDQHLARYRPQSDASESQFVLFSDVTRYSDKPLQKAP